MAFQEGKIKLVGKIGDLSFYKRGADYLVRAKGRFDGKRIKTEPQFEEARKNNSIFGRASKASKLLREAFRPMHVPFPEGALHNQLTKIFMEAIRRDGEIMPSVLEELSGLKFLGG
ncbi:hypothetical protein ACFOG5_06770 [Pedobacter fastidiosus]|uniref:Uncharacterized protein n=1 Tax=Pedobacter fastidiosus TaxID=2765361 RepID=A0ABR7KVZ0_9SPHI|nr:hypothetical protein [Pedobacter fastidiosus]MBC6111863.1 hypothetical protein [Pedobacter fastidiosus]